MMRNVETAEEVRTTKAHTPEATEAPESASAKISGKPASLETWQENAFDILRILAALGVLLKHFIRIGLAQGADFGALRGVLPVVEFYEPVVIFFAVSGFLNAASRDRSDSARDFLLRRAIRILPPLWLSAVIYALVLLFTVRPLSMGTFLKWLIPALFGVGYTPDGLKAYGTGSVNGALWMVFVLIQLYVLTAFLWPALKRFGAKLLIPLLLLAAAANPVSQILAERSALAEKLLQRFFIPYLIWYLIGVLAYFYKDALVPFLRRWGFAVFLGITALDLVGKLWVPLWTRGFYCGLPEGILAAAAAVALAYALPALRLSFDVSYEIFLNHWLLLNLMTVTGLYASWPVYQSLPMFLLGAVALAVAANSAVKRMH